MRTRNLLPLIAVTLSVAIAGCGSDNPDSAANTDAAAATSSTAAAAGGPGESALAYAKCMRDHGVDFPDPQIGADGGVTLTPGQGNDPDDPKVQEAQEACADLLQQGGDGASADPERDAEVQEQALAFSQCMREHGIDIPDPQVDGGGVLMGAGGADPNSPEFQEALQECQASSGLGAGEQP